MEHINEIIKINYDGEQPTVSARDLHKALGIEKRFSVWFETNSQGFVEGEDFTSVLSGTVVNNGAHRDLQDYNLCVDMAKHICLMSRTEKGKQCRQYLIDLEKAWNSPEQVYARALRMADDLLKRGAAKFAAGVFDINNETVALRIDFVPMWLAGISITPDMKKNKPELAEKLFEYQLKAKDVLAAAFLPKYVEQNKVPITEHPGGVASLINSLAAIMRQNGSHTREIAQNAELICQQYGICLIDGFVHVSEYEQLTLPII